MSESESPISEETTTLEGKEIDEIAEELEKRLNPGVPVLVAIEELLNRARETRLKNEQGR